MGSHPPNGEWLGNLASCPKKAKFCKGKLYSQLEKNILERKTDVDYLQIRRSSLVQDGNIRIIVIISFVRKNIIILNIEFLVFSTPQESLDPPMEGFEPA